MPTPIDHLMAQAQPVSATVTGAAATASWLVTANSVLQLVATTLAILAGAVTLYPVVKRNYVAHKEPLLSLLKNAQTKSLSRSALKIVGAAVAAYFGLSEPETATLVDALVTAAGAAVTLYGLYLSWKDKQVK